MKMFDDIYDFVEPNSERWLSLEDLPNERWKNIKDFENCYMISDYGRVKSLERFVDKKHHYFEKILRQYRDKDGYLMVRLSKNNKVKQCRVHQLVGDTFVDNPENKPIYNHIKPVTKKYCNNHYKNLSPVTYSENILYAYELGTKIRKNQYKGVKGVNNPFSKKVNQYDLKGNLIKKWDCIMDIERDMGLNHSSISACCRNKKRMKTYKGYIWKYNN